MGHQHQNWLFFGLSSQFSWSHLTMLVLAWGDWWALLVPLPVPLRQGPAHQKPIQPEKFFRQISSVQVTTDYRGESPGLSWVCSTHLAFLTPSHHREDLCQGRKHSSTSYLPFCFVLNHKKSHLLLSFSLPCNSKS